MKGSDFMYFVLLTKHMPLYHTGVRYFVFDDITKAAVYAASRGLKTVLTQEEFFAKVSTNIGV